MRVCIYLYILYWIITIKLLFILYSIIVLYYSMMIAIQYNVIYTFLYK